MPDADGPTHDPTGANRCGRMDEQVAQARGLLCLANRRGVRIPDGCSHR